MRIRHAVLVILLLAGFPAAAAAQGLVVDTPASWLIGGNAPVTWTVNGTSVAAPNVRILLSTDGGATFPIVLARTTPNDGAHTIQVPGIATTTARLKIEGVVNSAVTDTSDVDHRIEQNVIPAIDTEKLTPAHEASGVAVNPTLTWTANGLATGYRYCIDTTLNNACDTSPVDVGLATSVSVSGLLANTTYEWQVIASLGVFSTLGDYGQWNTFNTGGAPFSTADIFVDFGAAGLWAAFDTGGSSSWQQQHLMSPTRIASGDFDGNGRSELFAVFAGSGLWMYANSSAWVHLHPLEPSTIVTGDINGNGKDDLVASFPGAGVYVLFDDWRWVGLSNQPSDAIAIGNVDGNANGHAQVLIAWTSGVTGVWGWRDTDSWFQVHPFPATDLKTGDLDGNGVPDLVVQFTGFGEWALLDEQVWVQLHPFAANGMLVMRLDGNATADLVVNFPGAGLWALMNNRTAWVPLLSANITAMAAADLDGNGALDLVVSIPGSGLWVFWNNSNWQHLHPLSAEALTTGSFNDH